MFTLQELIELKTDFFKGKKVKLVRHKDSRTEYKDILKDREALLEYQKQQGREVFKNTDYLISFIGQESTKALLFGVFKVNGVDITGDRFYYNLTEVNIIDELIKSEWWNIDEEILSKCAQNIKDPKLFLKSINSYK